MEIVQSQEGKRGLFRPCLAAVSVDRAYAPCDLAFTISWHCELLNLRELTRRAARLSLQFVHSGVSISTEGADDAASTLFTPAVTGSV